MMAPKPLEMIFVEFFSMINAEFPVWGPFNRFTAHSNLLPTESVPTYYSRVASSGPFSRRLGLSFMVLNPRLSEPIEFV